MTIVGNINTMKQRVRKGSLTVEMMVAVGVLGAFITALAVVGNSFKKVDDYHWVQHTMVTAGQAQMDAVAVTGKPIDEDTFQRLWPTVNYTVTITPGEGTWQGLSNVQLHLSAHARQRTIKKTLSRYVRPEED